MNWTFEENSILKNYSKYTPCQDIFQAVCDEIGRYYTSKGWKYTRSRPKISLKNAQLKIEITFWSSRSNISGEYVKLEILPQIISNELIDVEKAKEKKSAGYILSFLDLFTERLENKPNGSKLIINTLEDNIERIEKSKAAPELFYNKNINVYGIDEKDFAKIIDFIESRIVVWIDRINDIKQIDTFLTKLTDNDKKKLLKSDFGKLIKLKFPTYKID